MKKKLSFLVVCLVYFFFLKDLHTHTRITYHAERGERGKGIFCLVRIAVEGAQRKRGSLKKT